MTIRIHILINSIFFFQQKCFWIKEKKIIIISLSRAERVSTLCSIEPQNNEFTRVNTSPRNVIAYLWIGLKYAKKRRYFSWSRSKLFIPPRKFLQCFAHCDHQLPIDHITCCFQIFNTNPLGLRNDVSTLFLC